MLTGNGSGSCKEKYLDALDHESILILSSDKWLSVCNPVVLPKDAPSMLYLNPGIFKEILIWTVGSYGFCSFRQFKS